MPVLPKPVSARRQSALRRKAARIALKLEEFQGKPGRPATFPPPLDMLIATILSQNTNDKNSHRAYTGLRDQYRTWREVEVAAPADLVSVLRVGGMAQQKARRIQETLRSVRAVFGGYDLASLRRMRTDRILKTLTAFPGVGVKTAACVIVFSLGRDLFPVDTHVHRICARLGLANGARTPEETFAVMRKLVPPGKGYTFHTNLIRFGRAVCRSNMPVCGECPLFGDCEFPDKSAARNRKAGPSHADHHFMLLDNV